MSRGAHLPEQLLPAKVPTSQAQLKDDGVEGSGMGLHGGRDGGGDGQRGVEREFGVGRAATQSMTAAERFAEKKKQAIARKER